MVRWSGGGLVHSHVAVRNLAQGHCERDRRAPGRLCGGDDGPRRRIRAAGEHQQVTGPSESHEMPPGPVEVGDPVGGFKVVPVAKFGLYPAASVGNILW